VQKETTTAQQAGGAEAEAGEARQAGKAEGDAPEPDKLTKAQPAGGGGAETAEATAVTDSGPDEAAEDQPAGADQAAAAEQPEAAEETETGEETEAAEGRERVITERADEEDAAGEGEAVEAVPAAAEGATIAADLDAARAEAESYLDDLRRLQADFDNYRKRTLREQTARAASASQALVARLLPVLDNFELAVSAAEQSRDFDRMLKGVEMVFGELREVLQSEGLVTIEAEGKPFDPERHEAVVAVEQEDSEPGTVVDIVRTGYELRGKVLRPAMVKVAK
jgi:molecular chaperone GrpE